MKDHLTYALRNTPPPSGPPAKPLRQLNRSPATRVLIIERASGILKDPHHTVGVFYQIQSLKNYFFLATAAFSLEPAVSFTP